MTERTAPPPRPRPPSSSKYRSSTSKVAVSIDGPMVRWLRKRNEMEMGELAERVGVTRAYVNKIEIGTSRQVSVRVFRALREALGLVPDENHVISADPTEIEEVQQGSGL